VSTAEDVVDADLTYICAGLGEELAQMSGHRLLVVGGAGFLGHYLVRSVLHWNATSGLPAIDVTVFDNYSRGVPDWLRSLSGTDHLTVRTFDITDPLPDDVGHVDYVVHAASIASPTYYRKHPIETMDANVNGLRTLLEYALVQERAGTGLKGFLYYSTSEIYGDPGPEDIPTPETYRGNVSCTGPRACYDESKRYGETLCVNFAQQHGLPVTVARPFNNYGPGLKVSDGRVIPDFARDILAGRDVVLLSTGAPTRTFCYVADAVIGYYKILVRGRPGEAYNIGTESPEISMAELADRMVRLAREDLGYEGSVRLGTSPEADYLVDNPNRRCPVITKAREQLGFAPAVTLDEGLRRSLDWYRDNNQGEDS
jgi:dTDP-glucose 4,6-dehydratase/UDP-glucuronate decarboxylase